MKRHLLTATACCVCLVSATVVRGDAYSDAVLALPGLVTYYRMNEHPAEIGDALINTANPGMLEGTWGYGDGNPDTLPLSGEEGPNPDSGFAGLDASNYSAYFGGNGADDNGDGQAGDNVADQMDLGAPDELDNEFASISLFMKASSDGNDSRIFTTAPAAEHTFRLVHGSNPDYGAMIVVTDPNIVDSSASVVTSDALFSDDVWHHLVVVRNGDDASESKFYLDGVDISDGFVDPIDTFGASESTARIGARHGVDNQGWGAYTGFLDEFAYWNRALTPEEATALYEAAIGGGGGVTGDFNADGVLTLADIDDLTAQSASRTNPSTYDLNADTLVDAADVNVWVKDLAGSWIGDANLNGEFNSTDLVNVLAAGTYEADVASVWSTGDFDGDGRTNSGDLVAALADGGYEAGPRAAVATVPEPASASLAVLACLGLYRRSRR
jgi:hypothetical protein